MPHENNSGAFFVAAIKKNSETSFEKVKGRVERKPKIAENHNDDNEESEAEKDNLEDDPKLPKVSSFYI